MPWRGRKVSHTTAAFLGSYRRPLTRHQNGYNPCRGASNLNGLRRTGMKRVIVTVSVAPSTSARNAKVTS